MLTTFIVLVALCGPVAAGHQHPAGVVDGSRNDLKGATTICVDPSVDPALRDVIIRQIQHDLPALKVTDSKDAATLVIGFSTSIPSGASDDDEGRKGAGGGERLSAQTNTEHVPPPRNMDQARLTTYSPSPQIVDPGSQSRAVDMIAPPAPAPGLLRYAHGTVVRVTDDRRSVEALTYTRSFTTSAAKAARRFARTFVKEYRQANRVPR
jgi:hypothetical protein